MKTYDQWNAHYDRLFFLGDCTKAQESRLAICLYNMVLIDGDCMPLDMRNYRVAAKRGIAYLDKQGLTMHPSDQEIADLAEMMDLATC